MYAKVSIDEGLRERAFPDPLSFIQKQVGKIYTYSH